MRDNTGKMKIYSKKSNSKKGEEQIRNPAKLLNPCEIASVLYFPSAVVLLPVSDPQL